MTLKGIASKAGVSISTVSRIINSNNNKCAKKETIDRVWEIASQLGYTPNEGARELKIGKAEKPNITGKIIGCISRSEVISSNSEFFSAIMRGIEMQTVNSNYALAYRQLINRSDNVKILGGRINTEVDGMIILGNVNSDLLKYIKKNVKNIIYTGMNSVDDDIDEVICNVYKATKIAMNYLIGLEHKHIGYLGACSKKTQGLHSDERYDAYLDTMKKNNLQINESHICNISVTIDGGYNGMNYILNSKNLPTSVFCSNDFVAYGAYKAIQEKNLSEHISIIGMYNLDISHHMTPMLTTINIPREEMGKYAVKTLIDRIEKGHKLPIKVILPTKLIKRDSCKKIIKQDRSVSLA